MPSAKQVKNLLAQDTPFEPPIPDDAWLSLGCTPLNLAVSGRARQGISKGMYVWYVGDSSSGKTWFALNLMAEATLNPAFSDYRFYFDNAERGAFMDIAEYFGPRLARAIEPPPAVGNVPAEPSTKIEEFYYHLTKALDDGPCIYILDSMDCLEGQEDEDKFLEVMEAYGTAKEDKVSGSYGTAVAKANSKNIKRYTARLEKTGSILVVINQLRDVIKTNPFSHGPTKRPGQGGHALRFYASVQLWTRIAGNLEKTVLNKKREYGKLIGVDVRKNRVSGWEGEVVVPFLRKHGLDEVGGCIDYLVDERHWTKADKGGVISAPELRFKGSREKLVQLIESKNHEGRLADLVEKVWRNIDKQTVAVRKNRYA